MDKKDRERVAFLVEALIYDIQGCTARQNIPCQYRGKMHTKKKKTKNIVPLSTPSVDALWGSIGQEFLTDVIPTDLVSPMNLTVASDLNDDKNPKEINGYVISTFRQLTQKELRGRPKAPLVIKWDFSMFDVSEGRRESSEMYFLHTLDSPGSWYRYNFRGWTSLHPWDKIHYLHNRKKEDPESILRLQLFLGMAFSFDYQWFVRIQDTEANNVSVLIPTTPERSKSIFKLRDVPPGKKRRSALRNWVTEHLRNTPRGNVSIVKEHLRGAESFFWNGLVCDIIPAPFDLRKNVCSNAHARV